MRAWSNGLYAFLVVGLFLPLSIVPLFIEAQKLHLFGNRTILALFIVTQRYFIRSAMGGRHQDVNSRQLFR